MPVDAANPISNHPANKTLLARWSNLARLEGIKWTDLVRYIPATLENGAENTNNGVKFIGTDDRVDVDTSSKIFDNIGVSSYSVIVKCYLRSSGIGSTFGNFIEKGFTSGDTGFGFSIRDGAGATDALQVIHGMNTGPDANQITNDNVVTYDQVLTVGYRWNRGGSVRVRHADIFYKGIEQSLATDVQGVNTYQDDTAKALTIGNRDDYDRPLDNIIYEVLIFKAKLRNGEFEFWNNELLNNSPLTLNHIRPVFIPNNITFTENLAADINGSATLTPDLVRNKLALNVDINGSALVVPSIVTPQRLTPDQGIKGSATLNIIFEKNLEHASNTISFSQEAGQLRTPGNTIGVSQSVTVEGIYNKVMSSTLVFTQDAEAFLVYKRNANNVIVFDHTASAKKALPTETASSTITFTDNADWARLGVNTLNLSQVAVGVIGGLLEDASNILSLTDQADVNTVLNLSALNNLILTHTVDPDQVINLTATNTLTFNQLVFQTILGDKNYVILQAPFDFLQTSIVIPAPLFGDTENITSEMSLRRSMNGKTITHVKTNKNRRLNYTFRILDDLKALELLEFVRYYNSDKIRLTNWKGEVWKVHLLTNPTDFIQTRRFGTDVSLEFEGEKLYG